MRRWLIRGGLLLLVLVAAWVALRPRPLAVDVAPVDRGPLRVTVDEDGVTRVVDRYTLSAPTAGALERVQLRPGDPVDVGAPVAQLEPTPVPLLDERVRAALVARRAGSLDAAREALARVDAAVAREAQARRELARVEQLSAGGAVPPRDVEAARLEARGAAQDLASARYAQQVATHEAEAARAALARLQPGARGSDERLVLRAPARGQVLRVLQESAGVVAPGAPLLEVGDVERLEVVVDVLTEDAVAIRPGAPVELRRWGGERPLAAQVRRVEPSAFTKTSALGVEEQRVNVVVDITSPPAARAGLGDGYRVEAAITTWEAPDVLRVPQGALFRSGGEWAAFVVEDGRARQRRVRVGHRGGLAVEVLEGLKAGERVILHPSDRVAEGVRVAPR